MANNSVAQTGGWVDQRMAALNGGAEWQPDISRGLARLRELQGRRRHARWIWPTVAVAAACLIVALLPQPRVLAHYCLDCTVAIWQNLSGLAMSEMQLQQNRQPAPDFALNNAAGEPVQLSRMKGKVVVLNFWATWCQVCKIEMPWFIEFEKRYKDSGLEIVGVSMDDDGWKAVRPYVQEKRVNYTVVLGNDELRNLYGAAALPVTVLIDRDGRIAASHAGLAKRTDYRKAIEALLKESSQVGSRP